jgi:uncharacterized protein YbcV (DUF1398 family)
MELAVKNVVERCAEQSHAGAISFDSMVGELMNAGVESYYADYRAKQTVYYMPDGTFHTVQLKGPSTDIAVTFGAAAVQAAVRGAQSGKVKYLEFQELTRAAGCVGYYVWIAGGHVAYQGRCGETHIEHFPS